MLVPLILFTFCRLVSPPVSLFIPQWLVITNPACFSRVDEVITVSRKSLHISKKDQVPIVYRHRQVLITQTADTDNDGAWDELFIAVSLAPHATDTLQIGWISPSALKVFDPRTSVLLSLRTGDTTPSPPLNSARRTRGFTQNMARPYYQMEGPGIENDKVAFRAFFDYRNGKDIYGKITALPVLEQVGVGASWHNLQPWGMDILQVGASLGAGGLAVEQDEKMYRLGDADTATFQTNYQGALQAAFKLDFKNWDVAADRRDGSETLSMTRGDYYYTNDISVPLERDQHLVAGIANFGIDTVIYKRHNAGFSSVSTYGNQAEGTKTRLGLAIVFATGDYLANKTADSTSAIPHTSYVTLRSAVTTRRQIRFFACWEKTDTRFSTRQGFEDYLQETADRLAEPIQQKIITKR